MEEKIREIIDYYKFHSQEIDITNTCAKKLSQLCGSDIFKLSECYTTILRQVDWIGIHFDSVEISFVFDRGKNAMMFIHAKTTALEEQDWMRHHIIVNDESIESMFWCLIHWMEDIKQRHTDKIQKKKPFQSIIKF